MEANWKWRTRDGGGGAAAMPKGLYAAKRSFISSGGEGGPPLVEGGE